MRNSSRMFVSLKKKNKKKRKSSSEGNEISSVEMNFRMQETKDDCDEVFVLEGPTHFTRHPHSQTPQSDPILEK